MYYNSTRLLPAAVRPGDDLEQVPARVLEVHAAPAEVGVDLALLLPARVGPVGEAARLDAAEDLVELGLADEKGVVLRLELLVGAQDRQRHPVRGVDVEERAEGLRASEAEHLGVEGRRSAR